MRMKFEIKRIDDAAWLHSFICERWGSPGVVSRGRMWTGDSLFALSAHDRSGLAGVVSWRVEEGAIELVTMDALSRGQGVGSALLAALLKEARGTECSRLWLVTTNDNLDALRFYQRRGWRIAAIHQDAVSRSRQLKPSIPQVGAYGISIRDEIEMEYPL
jgi:GNAT superfamily N-acetyltransferase